MTKPSLDELLRSGEWTGAEFKASKSALPKSVFETVSAFANTRGGWIVQLHGHVEGLGVDIVPQQHRRLDAAQVVDRLDAPPHARAVEHVVVHQRRGVQQFDDLGHSDDVVAGEPFAVRLEATTAEGGVSQPELRGPSSARAE